MTELIKNKEIISWNETFNLSDWDTNEAVFKILNTNNINNSFWKLIISQELINVDISKSKDELIEYILKFWNNIINEYKAKYEESFKERNDRFWLLDFYIHNWIKETLKNSFDSLISAHLLWDDIKWEISFKMYEIESWFVFIIRDNWSWKNAASSLEKRNNNENYIWWRWVWLETLNTNWYWKCCKAYYRVWKKWWAVTKIIIKKIN